MVSGLFWVSGVVSGVLGGGIGIKIFVTFYEVVFS